MKSATLIRLAAAVFFSATTLAHAENCVPAHKFTTVSPGVLTISMGALPPFDSLDSAGKYSGIEADLLKIVAAKECLSLKPILMDPSGQVQYVLTGKADLSAFGWYRSVARSKVFNLSTPLLNERLAIYSKDGTTSLEALKGRRVGTIQGYLWVPDLQAILGSSLKLYPNPVTLAQDLSVGRIDAGVDSYTKGIFAQRNSGGYPGFLIKPAAPDTRVRASVQPAQTAFLMRKDNLPLADAINVDIEEARRSGEMARILKTYGLEPDAANVGEPRLVQ